MLRKEIIVVGMVQGVGWRYHCLRVAQRFDITGYVKNEPDGTVKIVVEGRDDEVEEFIKYLQSSNYPGHVKSWKINNFAYTGEFKNFRVRY